MQNARGHEMRISLRRVQEEDLVSVLSWVGTHEEMVQWSGAWNFTFPLDERQLARFFLTENLDEGIRRIQFVAVEEESQTVVGQIGFSRLWSRTDAAHLGPIIVAPAFRGKGIGAQMMQQILRIGFDELRLHRIELVVFDFNAAAIACYERAGFRTEGRLRDIIRIGAKYWHLRAMSILEHEWRREVIGPREAATFQIRLCRAEDFDDVVALLQQLWPDQSLNREALRVVYDRALTSDSQMYLCATEGERVIGFGSLTLKNNLWQAGFLGHVDELVVDSKYRGQGAGTQILEELLAKARERGCRRVQVDSAFHREGAHRFYEQHGFEKNAVKFGKCLNSSTPKSERQ